MTNPFPDIDPYEALGVERTSTPLEIKKAYKRLCLKHHPDKVNQTNSVVEDQDLFAKVQFSYSILGDVNRRARYDQTGWLGTENDSDADGTFSWKDFFDAVNEGLTIDMIDEDRARYQNSAEEKNDILQNFQYYEGDFLKLFEVIPHLEFDEAQEQRVFQVIENAIASGDLQLDKSATKVWEKYVKSRKTKVKSMLKKLNKEAKEAAELEKSVLAKRGQRRGGAKTGTDAGLKELIQGRQQGRLNDLIGQLELKYGASRGKKRKSDISDEEFERIQAGLKRK